VLAGINENSTVKRPRALKRITRTPYYRPMMRGPGNVFSHTSAITDRPPDPSLSPLLSVCTRKYFRLHIASEIMRNHSRPESRNKLSELQDIPARAARFSPGVPNVLLPPSSCNYCSQLHGFPKCGDILDRQRRTPLPNRHFGGSRGGFIVCLPFCYSVVL